MGNRLGGTTPLAWVLTMYSRRLSIRAKDLWALGCSAGLTWRVACALSGHYRWGLSHSGQLRWQGDPKQAWELEKSLGKRCGHAQCAHYPQQGRAGTPFSEQGRASDRQSSPWMRCPGSSDLATRVYKHAAAEPKQEQTPARGGALHYSEGLEMCVTQRRGE